jgi:hypothetical protein
MTADRASEICNRLLEKYEVMIKQASAGITGKTYPELYDISTRKRTDAYDQFYEKMLDELSGMGIPIRD